MDADLARPSGRYSGRPYHGLEASRPNGRSSSARPAWSETESACGPCARRAAPTRRSVDPGRLSRAVIPIPACRQLDHADHPARPRPIRLRACRSDQTVVPTINAFVFFGRSDPSFSNSSISFDGIGAVTRHHYRSLCCVKLTGTRGRTPSPPARLGYAPGTFREDDAPTRHPSGHRRCLDQTPTSRAALKRASGRKQHRPPGDHFNFIEKHIIWEF